MAMISDPGTGSGDEHRSFRLNSERIGYIEDIAKGWEEGESGLKSCAPAYTDAKSGVGLGDARAMQNRSEVVNDEDECFNLIGEMLAKGFSFEEVAKTVRIDDTGVKLLALENWCQKNQLRCKPDLDPVVWKGHREHENRRRARRTLQSLMGKVETYKHAAVLHIVYGWTDPFVGTMTAEVRSALGREFAPLARYTDVVEEKRQEMARAEATRAAVRREGVYERPLARARDSFVEIVKAQISEAGEIGRLQAHLGTRAEPGGAAALFDLERARSARTWAERSLTSADAFRAAVAEPRARLEGEDGKYYREHTKKPAELVRDHFLTRVKAEANRMLSAASAAFEDAWRRS